MLEPGQIHMSMNSEMFQTDAINTSPKPVDTGPYCVSTIKKLQTAFPAPIYTEKKIHLSSVKSEMEGLLLFK